MFLNYFRSSCLFSQPALGISCQAERSTKQEIGALSLPRKGSRRLTAAPSTHTVQTNQHFLCLLTTRVCSRATSFTYFFFHQSMCVAQSIFLKLSTPPVLFFLPKEYTYIFIFCYCCWARPQGFEKGQCCLGWGDSDLGLVDSQLSEHTWKQLKTSSWLTLFGGKKQRGYAIPLCLGHPSGLCLVKKWKLNLMN